MKSVPATVVSCVDDNEEAVDLGGVEARQNLAAYLNVAAGQTQWAGADGVAGKGWQGMAMVLRVCLSLPGSGRQSEMPKMSPQFPEPCLEFSPKTGISHLQ